MTSSEIVKVNPEAFRQMVHLGKVTTEFGRRSAFLAVTYDESGNVTRRRGVTMPTHSLRDLAEREVIDGEIIPDTPELESADE